MPIVQIIDFNKGTVAEDKIPLNRGNGSLQLPHISGISGQTLKMKTSNDGVNWSYVKNEAGDADLEIVADDSFPLYMMDTYLALESNADATGIVASVGLKKRV